MDIIEEAKQALKFHKGKVEEYEAFLQTAEHIAAEMIGSRGNGTAQSQAQRKGKLKIKPRKKTTAKKRIGAAAREILATEKHMHTRDMIEVLSKRGIEVGGVNKIINLSSILGRDGGFLNDRKTGWSLK